MSFNLPPLPWLRAFESAARLGNFTLAAAELSLTPAAVSHQIRSLEGRLGYTLFRRRKQGLELTRSGQAYLPAVRRAFEDLSDATTEVFGRNRRSSLRLRCLQSFAQLFIIPRLPRFRAAQPAVRLQLHTAPWSGTLDTEQLDLDIRYGDGAWQDGAVELLMGDDIVPVVAPDLAAQVSDIADLAAAPLMEIDGVTDTWTRFFTRLGHATELPPPVLTVDQSIVALEMALQGAGHCLVFRSFAAPYLAEGRLVPSLPLAYRSDQGIHLVRAHSRQARAPDLEAFLSWLKAEVAEYERGV